MAETSVTNKRLAKGLGLVVFALVSQLSANAQTAAKWERLAPSGEEFTVMLPGKPEVTVQKKPFGQLTLTTNTYILVSDDGPMFMITSASGMQDFSAVLPENDGVNAYANGFWEGFLQPAKDQGLPTAATRLRDLTLNGYPGAAYDIVFGSMSGNAHVYKTNKKFYVALVLNTPKGDPRIEQFLTSFTLPEKTPRTH